MKPAYLAVCLAALAPACALAGPSEYVYVPTVEYGEKEVDLKYGSARQKDGSLVQGGSFGVGYGATSFWFTEFYLKYSKRSGESRKFDAVEWENKFQLTETGKYPVDIGFITELEITRAKDDPNEIRFGPLFQTEFGKLQLNANLLFTQTFGPNANSRPDFGYQWQAKYRLMKEFEFGLQGFGETGPWNGWATRATQNHRYGPAIFGKLAVGNHQAISYNAAWLIGDGGTTAPRNTFRLQVEYEF